MEFHWSHILRAALEAEFGARPYIATLATFDDQFRPRARTVVVREITDNDALTIVSDSRSQKNAQIRPVRDVELVFYLRDRREQFRLSGFASVIRQADKPGLVKRHWEALPAASRALFLWPAPGELRTDPDDAFIPALPATEPIPYNFELIQVSPDAVDHLQLAQFPHRRARWRSENDWDREEINP